MMLGTNGSDPLINEFAKAYRKCNPAFFAPTYEEKETFQEALAVMIQNEVHCSTVPTVAEILSDWFWGKDPVIE